MKENLLAENAVLSHTETKKLVQTFISIKSIPLPDLALRRSV